MISNKTTPKVSIIVPVYNAEKYISRLIDSVLAQTFADYELLLLNDGSKDSTVDVIKKYTEKYDNILLINKENTGVSDTRNVGLNTAKGKYITFIDADDFIDSDMLQKMVYEIEKNDADIVCSGHYIDDDGKTTKSSFPSETQILLHKDAIKEFIEAKDMGIAVWGKLYNKDLLENVYFSKDYRNYEDKLFLYEVLKKAQKVVNIPNVYYHYCMNDDSTTHKSFSLNKIKGLDITEKIYFEVSKKYPEFEIIAYANMITLFYYTVNIMLMDDADKKFKVEFNTLIKELKHCNLKKIKCEISKVMYLYLLLLKFNKYLFIFLKRIQMKLKGEL